MRSAADGYVLFGQFYATQMRSAWPDGLIFYQIKLLISTELLDLRFTTTGRTSTVLALHVNYRQRSAATKVLGTGTTTLMLLKASFNIRRNTGVQTTITGLNHVYKPTIHGLSATKRKGAEQRRQRYSAPCCWMRRCRIDVSKWLRQMHA